MNKAQITIQFILYLLILFLLSACVRPTSAQPNKYMSLRVENNSQKDIFVSLVSNGFRESFGGVPPNKSKTKGFSPIRFGSETVIQYSEETIEENNRFTINTAQLTDLKDNTAEIIFRYMGNEQWALVLLDTERNETFTK